MNITDAANQTPVERWADVGDLRIRYLDWGGDGPPIFALHGLASSAHWYDLVAPLLSDKFRVIAPDQRGHGQTTQAPTGYDWQSLSADVVGLMDHLDIPKAAVLGHSWGGNIAINMAARFPDRTSELVMIDGGFFGSRAPGMATFEELLARAAPRDVSGTRQQFLDRMHRQLAMCWNDDVERIVQTMVYEDDDGQMQDILQPDNHTQVMYAMWHDPAPDTWPNIQCPTLIVPAGPMPDRANSERAIMKRERVQAASETIKDNSVHWIPETVHDIGYHKPQELAAAIDAFLSAIGTSDQLL